MTVQKSLIFTITAGRSGTLFLTDFLRSNLSDARVYHERTGALELGQDTPDVSHLKQFNTYGYTPHVRHFWRTKMQRAIEEPGHYYPAVFMTRPS